MSNAKKIMPIPGVIYHNGSYACIIFHVAVHVQVTAIIIFERKIIRYSASLFYTSPLLVCNRLHIT